MPSAPPPSRSPPTPWPFWMSAWAVLTMRPVARLGPSAYTDSPSSPGSVTGASATSWSRGVMVGASPSAGGCSAAGSGTVVVAPAGAVVVVAGAVVVGVGCCTAAALSPSTRPTAPSEVSVGAAGAVVVVASASAPSSPGAAVVVVVPCPTASSAVAWASANTSAGTWPCCSTGRKRSSAVCPTNSSARSRFLAPGSCTTMASPWRVISGSATPRASTRSRMMLSAWSSCSPEASPVGARTTDTPPWRSRPSSGLFPETSVAASPPQPMRRIETSGKRILRRISSHVRPGGGRAPVVGIGDAGPGGTAVSRRGDVGVGVVADRAVAVHGGGVARVDGPGEARVLGVGDPVLDEAQHRLARRPDLDPGGDLQREVLGPQVDDAPVDAGGEDHLVTWLHGCDQRLVCPDTTLLREDEDHPEQSEGDGEDEQRLHIGWTRLALLAPRPAIGTVRDRSSRRNDRARRSPAGADVPPLGHLGPQVGQRSVPDRGTDPVDQSERPRHVVHRQQPRRGRLRDRQQVAQVAA